MSTLGTFEAGPTPSLIVGGVFISVTIWSVIMRDMVRSDGFAYFILGMASLVSTFVLMLVGMSFGSAPRFTSIVFGSAIVGALWVWLLTHIRSPKKFFTAIRLAFNRVEARQKRAALELADTEKRLLQLKSDPAYQQAMREVDQLLNPYSKVL